LGPLGTAATNRPVVPSPGDYDDGEIGGMMIGRGNRSTGGKPAPVPLCPPQTPHALLGCEPRSTARTKSYQSAGSYPTHTNINMTEAATCEVVATLALLNVGS
jgi:hypothetical protein